MNPGLWFNRAFEILALWSIMQKSMYDRHRDWNFSFPNLLLNCMAILVFEGKQRSAWNSHAETHFEFALIVGLIWHAWNFCYFQKKYLSRQGTVFFLKYIAAIFRKLINLFIRIYSLICFLNVYLIVFWTTLSLYNGFNSAQLTATLAFFGMFWIF